MDDWLADPLRNAEAVYDDDTHAEAEREIVPVADAVGDADPSVEIDCVTLAVDDRVSELLTVGERDE